MYQGASAPQSIGGVLDDGFRLYRAALPRVLALAFLGALIGQIPNAVLSAAPGSLPTLSIGLVVTLAICSVASALFYAGAVLRMNAVAEQRSMSLNEALSGAAWRLVPLLVFSLLYGLVVAVGLVLLIVPGVIFGLSLLFGSFIVLIEGKGPLEGMKTSHVLVWGNWWRTMMIVSVAVVVMIAAYILVGLVSGASLALGAGEPGITSRFLELVVVPLLSAVVAPLSYALSLAIYYDLRLRRSGTDLEQRLGVAAEA